MKQSFLVFPAGSTGFALLLLRASVSLSTVNQSFAGQPLPWLWITGCALLALAIGAGVFTRLAAVLSATVALTLIAMDWTMPSIACVTHVLPALVLAMTGPGAMSIDSRLFGRRTIHLPR